MACVPCTTDCSTAPILPIVNQGCAVYDDAEILGAFISSVPLPSVSADPDYAPPSTTNDLAGVSADIIAKLDDSDITTNDKIRSIALEGTIPASERTEIRVAGGNYVKGRAKLAFELEDKDLSWEKKHFWTTLNNCQIPVYFYLYSNSYLYGSNDGDVKCFESFRGYVSYTEEVTAGTDFNTGKITITVESTKGLVSVPLSLFDSVPFKIN